MGRPGLCCTCLIALACASPGKRGHSRSAESLDPALERATVTITGAYAVADEGSKLGGSVGPDGLIIKVHAREPQNPNDPIDAWPKVDFFVGEVHVGTRDDPGKYGTRTGVRFVRSEVPTIQNVPGSPLGDMVVYQARADRIEIRCQDGRLAFETVGEAEDELMIRVKTELQVGMTDVWQGGSPNPGAGDDFDTAAKDALAYSCGT